MTDEINKQEEMGDEGSGSAEQSWSEVTQNDLAAAEAAEQSYALPQKKSLNRNTVILLASCVLAVGAIFLLKLGNEPQEVSAEVQEVEAKVDKVLARLVDEKQREKAQQLFQDTEEMVQAFYEYPTKQQVPLKELQRNPFSRMMAEDGEAQNVADAVKRRERLRKELNKKVAQLQLQSVLRGSRGAKCMIDNEMFTEGAKVLDTFVVKSIKKESVVLAASNMEFVLGM